ncbi:NADP oxidoreductase coenzyme f420-dependent domain-containing protein [Trichoderma breve]|uniref:NADP oxidoreductase coenzyme f420-dependent domain-containing protein n=1 Tax=Trichoderma breve TaxID=2034170 RepID=A0A9W9B2C2_9HYPO|nr:NADP oxidoreductase coenzyme f420-dependent domain-containing protein [Trichoderma breve]KAJ4854322.1 NADP oxidoreductase coenzyme f420-dependent domain-containing protein [Trichoderma breve]
MAATDQPPKTDIPRQIAIIGAGVVGTALATQLIHAGNSVSISNSRGPESLRDVERTTGAKAMDTKRAVSEADVVILAIPMSGILPLQPLLQSSLRPDTILIDACNYYPTRDGNIQPLDEGVVESVWMSKTFSHPVVKALNNIVALNIASSSKTKGSPKRVALPVSGEDDKSVAVVMELVEAMGFDAFNAGQLADSWRQQPGQPAYCTEPNLKELVSLLSSANRDGVSAKRDQGMALAQKLPPDFPPQIMVKVARLGAGLDWWKPGSWLAAAKFAYALARASFKRSA